MTVLRAPAGLPRGPIDDLRGQVALVTGAGSGIGAAVAMLLAASGTQVVVSDLSVPAADRVVADIHAAGGFQSTAGIPPGSRFELGRIWTSRF